MNVQETLTQIDHILTEIDLVLWQWQTDLDMMSFLGVNATFELWTSDIPPRLVTKDVLSQAAGKELRVMNYLGGERVQIGTAIIDKHGAINAKITEDVPELRAGMAHFTMRTDGSVVDNFTGEEIALPRKESANPPFEGVNKPVTGIRLNDFHVEDGWVESKIYMKMNVDREELVNLFDEDWDLDYNVPMYFHENPDGYAEFLQGLDDETYWKYLNLPADEFRKIYHQNKKEN